MGPSGRGNGSFNRWVIIDSQCGPDIVFGLTDGKAKRWRHNAKHGVEFAVELKLAPQNQFVGSELRRPQRVADQHNARAGFFLICRKTATQLWADAQRREEAP